MSKHTLPELPFANDALEPHISAETLEYHHGKHHASYVKKLNDKIEGTDFASMDLEDIIRKAPAGAIFNNAAQVWNHTFYWNCLSPHGGGKPHGDLAAVIDRTFGSLDRLKQAFADAAVDNFGSGWTWLVKNGDGSIEIVNTDDAGNPLTEGKQPLLTCDVWEHAYYIDYRNSRPNYLKAYWQLVNWAFVERNYAA